jgi:leucyl aminopeptidase
MQIVRINGSSTTDNGVVIVGAHLDRCVSSYYLLLYKQLILCSPAVRTCGHSYLLQVISFCVCARQSNLNLQGADDDGSGSISILEAYRALLAADFHPVRTVEFHWYSAEVQLES